MQTSASEDPISNKYLTVTKIFGVWLFIMFIPPSKFYEERIVAGLNPGFPVVVENLGNGRNGAKIKEITEDSVSAS